MDDKVGRSGADAPPGSQASPGAAEASPPSVSIPNALREALLPFYHAAAVGWNVEDVTTRANLREMGLTPLIAFASYAGQHAAESRVSWANWKRLLDACEASGIEGDSPAPKGGDAP